MPCRACSASFCRRFICCSACCWRPTLLFLFRIVLTWYPQVDLSKGAMRLVALPTEPLLAPTRRLVAPIGGVDVTPVIWVGLISLVREILVGQQGLVTQVMLHVSVLPA